MSRKTTICGVYCSYIRQADNTVLRRYATILPPKFWDKVGTIRKMSQYINKHKQDCNKNHKIFLIKPFLNG